MIIVNADDWGRSRAETDAAYSCFAMGRITSASAMVFMSDSERAADLAGQAAVSLGLHLNLDEPFSSDQVSRRLAECHQSVVRFLKRGRYAQLLYHPLLRRQFEFVFHSQLEEFVRLHGRTPTHLDGHRHMHLCTNMLLGRIAPPGFKVRRSFSFWPGEKGLLNRAYRRLVDAWLRRRHVVTDYFFSLAQCLETGRMPRVASLALKAKVELMAHPRNAAEFTFLQSDAYSELFSGVPRGSYADL